MYWGVKFGALDMLEAHSFVGYDVSVPRSCIICRCSLQESKPLLGISVAFILSNSNSFKRGKRKIMDVGRNVVFLNMEKMKREERTKKSEDLSINKFHYACEATIWNWLVYDLPLKGNDLPTFLLPPSTNIAAVYAPTQRKIEKKRKERTGREGKVRHVFAVSLSC